jgi:UDP-N-acetylmuramate: L-alanyl-gamma-D-glutamyl-meso-diaminopimelate ligase
VVSDIPDLHKFPENDRLDPAKLVADIGIYGGNGRYIHSVDEIVATVAKEARPGDVVAVLSNGGFGGIHKKLLESLG